MKYCRHLLLAAALFMSCIVSLSAKEVGIFSCQDKTRIVVVKGDGKLHKQTVKKEANFSPQSPRFKKISFLENRKIS